LYISQSSTIYRLLQAQMCYSHTADTKEVYELSNNLHWMVSVQAMCPIVHWVRVEGRAGQGMPARCVDGCEVNTFSRYYCLFTVWLLDA